MAGHPTAKGHWASRAKLLAGSLVSVLLLGWILSLSDIGNVFRAIRGVPVWAVLATLGIIYTSIPVRVLQWRLLLGPRTTPAFRPLLRAISLGYLGNLLLPMGGGEFLKSFLLARTSKLTFPRILGSIVLVRLQDVLLVLVLAAVATVLLPLAGDVRTGIEDVLPHGWNAPEAGIRWALGMVTLGCALGIVMLVGVFLLRRRVRYFVVTLLVRISHPLAEYAAGVMDQFMAGVDALGSPRRFAAALGLAGLCWFIFALAPLPLLLAFSFGPRQACMSALVVTGLATLAQLLPIAPAGLGTYHALCILALSAVNPGADRDVMVAYALVSHFIGTVGPALAGLVFLPESLTYVRLARESMRSGGLPTSSGREANARE